ncbi:MAG: hypothetical protein ABI345_03380 [Jatrophihabitans sp.]
MNDHADDMSDPIARLSAYRPTTATIEREWPLAQRGTVRARADSASARVRFTPRRRRLPVLLAPVAAGFVLVSLIGGVVVFVARSDDGARDSAAGQSSTGDALPAEATRQTPRVGPEQYAYRSMTYPGNTNGSSTDRLQAWASADGRTYYLRTAHGSSTCVGSSGQEPSQASFDALPTDPVKLHELLRAQAQGSSTRDEAEFVGVGDLLRNSDGLASSQTRYALVAALSLIRRVTVHTDVLDPSGRSAIRVDLVDQGNRPGELDALYFDPATFQLLAEATGNSGLTHNPTAYKSSGYDATGSAATTPVQFTGLQATVMTQEKVVDSVPPAARTCS